MLTGGPCGGKSSALAMLQERLTSFGYSVYCIPETATIFNQAGVSWPSLSTEQVLVAQSELMRTQVCTSFLISQHLNTICTEHLADK